MTVQITIDCDNAAFEDDNGGAEVARILGCISSAFEDFKEITPDSWKLRDINGNTVGKVVIS